MIPLKYTQFVQIYLFYFLLMYLCTNGFYADTYCNYTGKS